MRRIVDLTTDELKEIIKTDALPPDVSLEGLEERSDFEKLFNHRHKPKFIAAKLFKEKAGTQNPETFSLREERLSIQKETLELRKQKAEKTTWQFQQIKKQLDRIEKMVNLLYLAQQKDEL